MRQPSDPPFIHGGDAVPVWEERAGDMHVDGRALIREPLARDVEADVCVVGAGIFGLTAAYLLQRSGRRTIVIDDGPIAGGQSARTTAHLATAIDGRFAAIEKIHGRETARLVAESHVAAIGTIEEVVRDERIACDLRRLDGFLCAAAGDEADLDALRDERDAAVRAGLEVELLDRAPVPGFAAGPCLRFAGQGRLHPVLHLAGLAEGFERAGGRIHTGTRADSIAGGAPAHVGTAGGAMIACGAVVVATGSPITDRLLVHARQAPYMSYVVSGLLPGHDVPDVLLWDTAEPYHYVRLAGAAADGTRRLIVGGEDHKTGHAHDGAERFARLEGWARERFPGLRAIDHRWAGQVFEPADLLAFIGPDPLGDANVFIGTGFSGNGYTYGTLAGMLVRDLVCERENPWRAAYDPARFRASARPIGRLLRENLDVAARFGDWLRPGDVADESAIAAGDGAIVRRGLDRLAVHRDAGGTLHRCHAACPHMGCSVAWNRAERTWDCPCHGSRFTATGRLIVGPANRDLRPVEAPHDEELHGEQDQV